MNFFKKLRTFLSASSIPTYSILFMGDSTIPVSKAYVYEYITVYVSFDNGTSWEELGTIVEGGGRGFVGKTQVKFKIATTRPDFLPMLICTDIGLVLSLTTTGEVVSQNYTLSSNITVTASLYVIDPIFDNNSWPIIKAACQNNEIPSTWALGDTKEFVGKDGNTYHAMIYDKQVGRYAYSDGSGRRSNSVIGFVELPNIQTQWNTTYTNVGGLADSQLRKNLNGLAGVETGKNFMTQIIPDDLAALLEEVNITTATTGSSWNSSKVSTSANKLFPPVYANISSTTIPQYVAEGTLWDWYTTHTSNNDRKKALVTNPTSYQNQLTASPLSNTSGNVNVVSSYGSMDSYGASGTNYVAPHWAW